MLIKIIKTAYVAVFGLLVLAATCSLISFTLGLCFAIAKFAFKIWN